MCTATQRAQRHSVVSCVVLFGAVVLGGVVAARPSENETTWVSLACSLLGLGAVTCQVLTVLDMLKSPLFGQAHNNALSTQQRGIPYNGYQCSFQTPLYSPLAYLVSSPLKCLFPGPAFAGIMLGVVSASYSCVFFVMHTVEVYATLHPRKSTFAAGLPIEDSHSPLTDSKHYSVFNALSLKLADRPAYERVFLVIVLPFLTMMGNAISWCMFLLYGSQIIGLVRIEIVRTSMARDTATGRVADLTPAAVSAAAALVPDALPLGEVYRDVANVFNFSPLVSTKFFWDGGAYLVTCATLVTILILPVARVLFWLWLFFVPTDSALRGRVLTVLDFVGKYLLANLFIICIMGSAMAIDKVNEIPWYAFPPGALQPGTALRLSAGTKTSTDSLGSWMFIVSCFFSLVIGQAAVVVHQFTEQWQAEHLAAVTFDDLTPVPSVFSRMRRDSLTAMSASPAVESLLSIHVSLETLVDHVFVPAPNRHIRLSPRGKATVWASILILFGFTLIALVVPIFAIKQYGFMGDFAQDPAKKYREFSVLSLIKGVGSMGYTSPTSAYNFGAVMVVFCIVFPLVRVAGLVLLVAVPLTLVDQKRVFDWLEIFSAWASLDVLFTLVAVMHFEMVQVSSQIMGNATPKLSKLLLEIFSFEPSFFTCDVVLLGGFWFMLAALVIEKVVVHLLTSMAVASITERIASSSDAGSEPGQALSMEHVALLFSPATRYVFLSDYVYAGLPRGVWRWLARFGLFEELAVREPSLASSLS